MPCTATETVAAQLRQWNWGDRLLHEHFLRRLDRQLHAAYPRQDDLRRDLEELRERRRHWRSTCIAGEQSPSEAAGGDRHSGVKWYALKRAAAKLETCRLVVMGEVDLIRAVNEHQTQQCPQSAFADSAL